MLNEHIVLQQQKKIGLRYSSSFACALQGAAKKVYTHMFKTRRPRSKIQVHCCCKTRLHTPRLNYQDKYVKLLVAVQFSVTEIWVCGETGYGKPHSNCSYVSFPLYFIHIHEFIPWVGFEPTFMVIDAQTYWLTPY